MWPNGLRVSRAAPIDRHVFRVESSFQNANDLGPRSGVGCTRGLGGYPCGYTIQTILITESAIH
jgi:hypothetical protein